MDSTDLTHTATGPGPDQSADAVRSAKQRLRAEVLAARRRTEPEVLAVRAEQLGARVLALPEVEAASCVAAYVSTGTEPGTGPLLAALHARGVRVLLPLLRDDLDLDWAPYEGPDSLRPAARGLREPATAPLGVEAVRTADVLLVPGLAVSTSGLRSGRGGGSYDRVLARVPATFTCVLLHPGEVGLEVPAESHDRVVDAAVTSDLITRFD